MSHALLRSSQTLQGRCSCDRSREKINTTADMKVCNARGRSLNGGAGRSCSLLVALSTFLSLAGLAGAFWQARLSPLRDGREGGFPALGALGKDSPSSQRSVGVRCLAFFCPLV